MVPFGIEIECYVDLRSLADLCGLYYKDIRDIDMDHIFKKQPKGLNDIDFSMKGDGSLNSVIRGKEGVEFVSEILTYPQHIRKIEKTLYDLNAQVDGTCGLHVHLDAQSILGKVTVENVRKIVARYGRDEERFFNKICRDRNNTYCQPISKFERLNFDENDNINPARISDKRYTNINTLALEKHNTLEFRQHHGTIDVEEMENWVNFLQQYVKFTVENVNEEIKTKRVYPNKLHFYSDDDNRYLEVLPKFSNIIKCGHSPEDILNKIKKMSKDEVLICEKFMRWFLGRPVSLTNPNDGISIISNRHWILEDIKQFTQAFIIPDYEQDFYKKYSPFDGISSDLVKYYEKRL